ncbi:hypothetical protein JCM6882_008249 [Rhodosporidiobolus microsporus]
MLSKPAEHNRRRTILLALAFYVVNYAFSGHDVLATGGPLPTLRPWHAISPYILLLLLPSLNGSSSLTCEGDPLEVAHDFLQILLGVLSSTLASVTGPNRELEWTLIEASQKGFRRAQEELKRLPLEAATRQKVEELLNGSCAANDQVVEMTRAYAQQLPR